MEAPRLIVLGLFCLAALVLVLTHRRRSLMTLAVASSLVYFAPAVAGFAVYRNDGPGFPVELEIGTYMVIAVVLATQIGALALLPRVPKRHVYSLEAGETIAWVLCGLMALGAMATIVTGGTGLLAASKHAVMDNLGRWHILTVFSAILLLATGAETGHRGWIIAASLVLVGDLFLGFRAHFAIGVLSALWIFLERRSWSILSLRTMATGGLMAASAVFMFAYKHLYAALRSGQWSLISERLLDPSFALMIFVRSEPFTTQAVLNAVIAVDLQVSSIGASVIGQMVPASEALGWNYQSFNDLYQPLLFPDRRAGMAANFWAQLWAEGRLPYVFAGVLVVCLLLRVLDHGLVRTRGVLHAALVNLGVLWAFYLHRNDVSYQLNLSRRVLVVLIAAWLLAVGARTAVRAICDRWPRGRRRL